MKYQGLVFSAAVVAVLAFNSLTIVSSYAADMLYLRGVVKKVDPIARTVTIDVRSRSCPGERDFITGDVQGFRALLEKAVFFSIDADSCRGDARYIITNYSVSGEKQ